MIEIVMCIACDENKVLLVRRKNNGEKLSWVFPGGTVEVGETPFITAVRELKEETNIDSEAIEFIGERLHPYTKKHVAYVAVKPTSFELKLGDDDLDSLEWVEISRIEEYFKTSLYEAVKEYFIKSGLL